MGRVVDEGALLLLEEVLEPLTEQTRLLLRLGRGIPRLEQPDDVTVGTRILARLECNGIAYHALFATVLAYLYLHIEDFVATLTAELLRLSGYSVELDGGLGATVFVRDVDRFYDGRH